MTANQEPDRLEDRLNTRYLKTVVGTDFEMARPKAVDVDAAVINRDIPAWQFPQKRRDAASIGISEYFMAAPSDVRPRVARYCALLFRNYFLNDFLCKL